MHIAGSDFSPPCFSPRVIPQRSRACQIVRGVWYRPIYSRGWGTRQGGDQKNVIVIHHSKDDHTEVADRTRRKGEQGWGRQAARLAEKDGAGNGAGGQTASKGRRTESRGASRDEGRPLEGQAYAAEGWQGGGRGSLTRRRQTDRFQRAAKTTGNTQQMRAGKPLPERGKARTAGRVDGQHTNKKLYLVGNNFIWRSDLTHQSKSILYLKGG